MILDCARVTQALIQQQIAVLVQLTTTIIQLARVCITILSKLPF
jgi:hypothetical protein